MCVILAVVLLLFPALVAVAGAQEMPSPPPPSPWVTISANPSEIAADGISTSKINVTISRPPIGQTKVDIDTTLGWLTEVVNESNSGSKISLVTDYNGTAIALLSGNETGVAEIKVWWFGDENNITSTSVTFLEPGATPSPTAPSGNGGIPPTPPAGTPAHIALGANPADIPADGVSTSTITASVWDGEDWVLDNLTVNFSTSLGKITASAVIENGTATAILTAGKEDLGVATITAEANLNADIGTVTNTTRVNFTTLGVTPTPAVNVTQTPTPTVTASPTPAATVSPTPSPTKKPLIPGFEAVFAIASLLAVAHLVLRRGREAQP